MTIPAGWSESNCSHLSDVEKQYASRWLHIVPSTIDGPPVGMVVGEAPGQSQINTLPLFPTSKASTGGLLLRYSGLTIGQYLGRLMRVNLMNEFSEEWNHVHALKRAHDLIKIIPRPCRVLLIGRRVGLAFGFEQPFVNYEEDRVFFTVLPHPKLNRDMYKSPGIRVGVKAAFSFAAGYLGIPKEEK